MVDMEIVEVGEFGTLFCDGKDFYVNRDDDKWDNVRKIDKDEVCKFLIDYRDWRLRIEKEGENDKDDDGGEEEDDEEVLQDVEEVVQSIKEEKVVDDKVYTSVGKVEVSNGEDATLMCDCGHMQRRHIDKVNCFLCSCKEFKSALYVRNQYTGELN